VRHEAGSAPSGTAVEQPIFGLNQLQLVEQDVGLAGFKPVQLLVTRSCVLVFQ
jgi:hypothetical protein